MHFTSKDGLSSNRVRAIKEDKQGNIYIATLEGINKFDGNAFTALIPIKSNSPYENWKLQPDDLWFSMPGKSGDRGPYRYDGINLYQLEFPEHAMADAYFTENPNKPWSPYEVYSIYKDRKGHMWFGTGTFGVCRYDGQSLDWLYEDHLTYPPNGGSFGIRSILEDAEGKFWFCNTRYRYDISPHTINDQGQNEITYEKSRGIDGITSVNGNDHIYFMSALEDNKGQIWMATYNEGVWSYDGKETKQYVVKDGTNDVTVFSIYKDNNGDLWLGTHEHGAYKFNGDEFERVMQ
jgi:ligand-binding sensor domain-containing protein